MKICPIDLGKVIWISKTEEGFFQSFHRALAKVLAGYAASGQYTACTKVTQVGKILEAVPLHSMLKVLLRDPKDSPA